MSVLPSYAELLRRYRRRHGPLVEPIQGFSSLHESLHLAYSMGRVRGFTDLGTYVNKPLDHGGKPSARRPPAWAFDLGRKDRFLFKGWGYLKARRLAKLYVANYKALNINYVILGKRIWSRSNGWQPYADSTGSHSFHLHISGYHGESYV